MSEHGDGRRRFVTIVLVAAVIGGVWWLCRRPATHAALESAADVIVPAAPAVERQRQVVDEARRVTEQINARSSTASH